MSKLPPHQFITRSIGHGRLAFASTQRLRTAVFALVVLTSCGCGTLPRSKPAPGGVVPAILQSQADSSARNHPTDKEPLPCRHVSQETPSLSLDEEPAPTAPAQLSEEWWSGISGMVDDAEASEQQTAPQGPVVADARLAALEGRLQWLGDDVTRVQQALNQVTQDEGETDQRQLELERRHAGLVQQHAVQQKLLSDYRKALDAAYQSYSEQQSTIETLSRRLAELEITFVRKQTQDDLALDKVIDGMEQLLQLQASEPGREHRSHQETN